jgi:polyisoprenoid-binding protein YceI
MSTTQKWTLDPYHSEINFKVRHMMIAHVSGGFTSFNVQAETEGEDFSKSKVSFDAEVSSINTKNEQRDTHLKSAEFFNAEQYPKIKFQSTSVQPSAEGYEVQGHLTVRDITKPVSLKAEFGGIAKDPYGNTKAGFTLTGKINRNDFGLTWNAPLEAGGVLVGEDLNITADIQLNKQ